MSGLLRLRRIRPAGKGSGVRDKAQGARTGLLRKCFNKSHEKAWGAGLFHREAGENGEAQRGVFCDGRINPQ